MPKTYFNRIEEYIKERVKQIRADEEDTKGCDICYKELQVGENHDCESCNEKGMTFSTEDVLWELDEVLKRVPTP